MLLGRHPYPLVHCFLVLSWLPWVPFLRAVVLLAIRGGLGASMAGVVLVAAVASASGRRMKVGSELPAPHILESLLLGKSGEKMALVEIVAKDCCSRSVALAVLQVRASVQYSSWTAWPGGVGS
jgi:hypothetical protein